MNGLVAAIKFLMETVNVTDGAVFTLTYSAQEPASGQQVGTFPVALGFLAGYYTFRVSDAAGITPTDDSVSYFEVTAQP